MPRPRPYEKFVPLTDDEIVSPFIGFKDDDFGGGDPEPPVEHWLDSSDADVLDDSGQIIETAG